MRNERSFLSVALRRVVGASVAALLLVAALAASFIGAGVETSPREVPIAVTGGDQVAARVADQLDQRRPGAFEVTPARDAADARAQIGDRQVYGAIVTQGPRITEVLVAGAASPAVAQALSQVAGQLGVPATDIAPAPPEDPRGAGLAGGALPITISGILVGMILVFLLTSVRARVIWAPVLGSAFGAVLLAVIRGAYSALTGSAVQEWLAISAGVTAIALVLIGSHRLLGRAGLVTVELLLIVLGNPWSAATSAPELLPEPWAAIGHWMPLGATVHLLRGISGFDGAGSLPAVIALSSWAALGLAMAATGSLWQRRRPSAATSEASVAAEPLSA